MQVKKLLAYKGAIESLRASTNVILTKNGVRYSFSGRCGQNPQIDFALTKDQATSCSNGRYTLTYCPEGDLVPRELVDPALQSLYSLMPESFLSSGTLVRVKITRTNNSEPYPAGRFNELCERAEVLANEARESGRATSNYWLLSEVESGLRGHESLKPWQKVVVKVDTKKWTVCVHTDDYFGGVLDAVFEVDRDDVHVQSDEPAVVA